MITPVSPLSAGIGLAPAVGATPAIGLGASAAVPSAQPASFGEVMTQVATGAVDTLKKGEAMAISGVEGKASVQHVVEAVMNADQTLQTALAIRDKVVSAYQEISRMAI